MAAINLVQRCSARLADAEDAVLHRLRNERSQRIELENSLAAARAEIAQYAAGGGPPEIQSELEQGREALLELSSMRTGLETAADWLVALRMSCSLTRSLCVGLFCHDLCVVSVRLIPRRTNDVKQLDSNSVASGNLCGIEANFFPTERS